MSSFNWPTTASGIPIYPTVADFPATGNVIGQQAVAADSIPNIYEWTGSAWVLVASGAVSAVTSVSVVSANGFAGTVATATTTPAITLTTTVTGLLQGNGTAVTGLAASTSGNVATSNGSTWVSSAPAASASSTVTQVTTNASFYPVFVSGNTTNSYALDVGTGLSFNPSTNILTTTGLSATNITNMASTTYVLDISSGIAASNLFGADSGALTRTNSTNKVGYFNGIHYTLAQTPIAILNYSATSAATTLSVGGGSGQQTACTVVRFYTAANNTTLTGTLALNIDTSQNVSMPGGNLTVAKALTIGTTGSFAPTFTVNGLTSGTISFKPQINCGTYNYNWPVTSGSATDLLTSDGGSTNGGQTWTPASATPAAASVTKWDANINLSAANILNGIAITATAAGTTTLIVGSKGQQFFNGSTTQTCVLPVASTLALGQSFRIVNLSSGVVTVNSSGGNTLQAMASNTQLWVTCILTSGTGTASWAWF